MCSKFFCFRSRVSARPLSYEFVCSSAKCRSLPNAFFNQRNSMSGDGHVVLAEFLSWPEALSLQPRSGFSCKGFWERLLGSVSCSSSGRLSRGIPAPAQPPWRALICVIPCRNNKHTPLSLGFPILHMPEPTVPTER